MAFYIFLSLTILWFLFMTYLSHQDGEHTGKASRELAEKLSALDFLDHDINILNSRLRRLAHVVVYAVLTVLLAITLKLGGYFPWLTAGAPGQMKRQSRWCKAAIFLGLMWDETCWGL